MQEINGYELHSSFEQDPRQLKILIQDLMHKTKTLIHNLELVWGQLDETEKERNFWKQSYMNLKDSIKKYVQAQGLAPFTYITQLQEQLKKERVYKSCLQEKFRVMYPPSILKRKNQLKISQSPFKNINKQIHSWSKNNENNIKNIIYDQKKYSHKSVVSSTAQKDFSHEKSTDRVKIGPKQIQVFKFSQE